MNLIRCLGLMELVVEALDRIYPQLNRCVFFEC